MTTQLQRKTFNLRAKKIKEGKRVILGDLMREAGFSDSLSRTPKVLVESKGWQALLAEYDDKPIMDAIYKDALDTKDKRNATENRKLILKLKNRFPAAKMKIGAFDEREEVLTDDENNLKQSPAKEDRVDTTPQPEEDSSK